MVEMDARDYYAEHADREFERLTESLPKRLEWEHTVATLDDVLPESAVGEDGGGDRAARKRTRVLDAGGGPGRYSIWLADRGHDVAHCDLTPELVALAREKTREAGVADRVDATEADVRDLPYEDDAFDAVCSLGGVLNHVVDAGERERAVAELRRVARPGAPVAVSVISRVGGARYTLKALARDDDPDPSRSAMLAHYARTGDFTEAVVERYGGDDGWAAHHAFRVAELEALLDSQWLAPERVVALEGATAGLHEELDDVPEHVADAARDVADAWRDDRALADASEHFLVVARA
jgi:SAM-dependent methyltransferase